MWNFTAWRQRRVLNKYPISVETWEQALSHLPLLHGFTAAELTRLKELAVLFLHKKVIETAGDLELNESMKLIIALQACLPILYLGLDWYEGWVSIIVYPAGFMVQRDQIDTAGIVHPRQQALSGESWLRGPVIISWSDAAYSGYIDGHNLLIHEFAHKLDMQNGNANGMPPLHKNMDRKTWTEVFSHAYAELQHMILSGHPTPIDPYGVESPAEFFAVLSEVFFETPNVIQHYYPAVYPQLRAFYRQDPASRLGLTKPVEPLT